MGLLQFLIGVDCRLGSHTWSETGMFEETCLDCGAVRKYHLNAMGDKVYTIIGKRSLSDTRKINKRDRSVTRSYSY